MPLQQPKVLFFRQNHPRPPVFLVYFNRLDALDIFQPDITKYCCIHDAIRLLESVKARDKRLFPHFLGSAPGQAASLHLASGCGDILMEWDVNPNPLRTSLFKDPIEIQNGLIKIPDAPGIGWELDSELVEIFLSKH